MLRAPATPFHVRYVNYAAGFHPTRLNFLVLSQNKAGNMLTTLRVGSYMLHVLRSRHGARTEEEMKEGRKEGGTSPGLHVDEAASWVPSRSSRRGRTLVSGSKKVSQASRLQKSGV